MPGKTRSQQQKASCLASLSTGNPSMPSNPNPSAHHLDHVPSQQPQPRPRPWPQPQQVITGHSAETENQGSLDILALVAQQTQSEAAGINYVVGGCLAYMLPSCPGRNHSPEDTNVRTDSQVMVNDQNGMHLLWEGLNRTS